MRSAAPSSVAIGAEIKTTKIKGEALMERHESAARAPSFWDDLTLRPHCPECRMRMISIAAAQGKRSYECLRCGHAADPLAEVSR
jgi:hypothetical protein